MKIGLEKIVLKKLFWKKQKRGDKVPSFTLILKREYFINDSKLFVSVYFVVYFSDNDIGMLNVLTFIFSN